MRKPHIVGLATLVGLTLLAPATAHADDRDSDGSSRRTVADVLLADSDRDDKQGFDHRSWDYDIVTQAILLYPDLVAAASDPKAQLTVFLPNDQAFRKLVNDVAGKWLRNEADVFGAVASLGSDTVLSVLQYHIVPAAISYRTASKSDGVGVPTLLTGASITVDISDHGRRYVRLVDADTNDRDPVVVSPNVGGRLTNGYAHGIDRVLRPIDLP
jgi:uncharacterized surface protein with fasciclin (FAS1) repeats